MWTLVATRPRRSSRRCARLALLALCTCILSSAFELHALAAAHASINAESLVSVDARHARQGAHVEHSELELRSRCPTCVLTNQPGIAVSAMDTGLAGPPPARRLTRRALFWPLESLALLAPSRAPPLS